MDARDINLWLMRMKLVGIEAYGANHSLVPVWFEKRFPGNKKILARGYEHPTQLNLMSPELLKMVVEDADDYFAGKTNYERSYGDYFCVVPHDNSNYSKDPKSRALLKSKNEIKGYGQILTFLDKYLKEVKTVKP